MLTVTLGLQQSLLIKAQRRLLDRIGATLGTPVVYLKAAWADPVLYGGRGERFGGDIDVLVRPTTFGAFARALAAEGFCRYREPWHMASHQLLGKAWLYRPPNESSLAVDLHREVADSPWFKLPADDLLDRAVAYPSVDGSILSLSPDDQVVYAAAHYANHRYALGPKHLNDVVALLSLHHVDWQMIWQRAEASFLCAPLMLLIEALRGLGVKVPQHEPERIGLRWRRVQLRRWLSRDPTQMERKGAAGARDFLVFMPMLSDRLSGLPRYVLRSLSVRSLDVALEVAYRAATARHGVK